MIFKRGDAEKKEIYWEFRRIANLIENNEKEKNHNKKFTWKRRARRNDRMKSS